MTLAPSSHILDFRPARSNNGDRKLAVAALSNSGSRSYLRGMVLRILIR